MIIFKLLGIIIFVGLITMAVILFRIYSTLRNAVKRAKEDLRQHGASFDSDEEWASSQQRQTGGSSQSRTQNRTGQQQAQAPHQKIFSKDEGEYVEYEEV